MTGPNVAASEHGCNKFVRLASYGFLASPLPP